MMQIGYPNSSPVFLSNVELLGLSLLPRPCQCMPRLVRKHFLQPSVERRVRLLATLCFGDGLPDAIESERQRTRSMSAGRHNARSSLPTVSTRASGCLGGMVWERSNHVRVVCVPEFEYRPVNRDLASLMWCGQERHLDEQWAGRDV
jgi:hypothetical protein